MFHTYVRNAKGVDIDVDRAMFLMDKGLRDEALAYADANYPHSPEFIAHERAFAERNGMNFTVESLCTKAEIFWARYTSLHSQKYGEYFSPDMATEPF